MIRFVIITGPSGSGKTHALHGFEDIGYYAVDNLPPRLLPPLSDFCEEQGFYHVAVVVDSRCGASLQELPEVVHQLRKKSLPLELLFLDASDETLVRRYKEMRRPHPILTEATEGGIVTAIQQERQLLEIARTLADQMMDTSPFTISQFREAIHTAYAGESRPGMLVTITSFGFKYGIPLDSDLVFDVRFLLNPHYVPELKPFDGRDARVAEYVRKDARTQPFQEKLTELVLFALPQYAEEGKAYLNVAIGCTGGKHRSVMLTEELANTLKKEGYRVVIHHRDVNQDKASSGTLREKTT